MLFKTNYAAGNRMPEAQSPINSSSSHSEGQTAEPRRGFAFWVRVGVFVIVVLGCGWYSRFFQSLWTTVFPLDCAAGSSALFAVDYDEFPARIGEQENLCVGVGDGACQRNAGDEMIHGECRSKRMHGHWSVADKKTRRDKWSGMYCDGLPCGDFRVRVDSDHEDAFRVDKLHLDGPTTIWELRDKQIIEYSGRYERGLRSGQWIRRLEPSHTMLSAFIYDRHGFIMITTFYCTNGNRKEIRGQGTFLFDAQGNTIASSLPNSGHAGSADSVPDAGTIDPSLCPLP